MGESLIPEIVRKEITSNTNTKENIQNLNLIQNIDRRINTTTNSNTYNTTNNNYTKSGGLFKFLFDVVTIPFKIIYKIFILLEKKFDIKETLRLEKESLARKKWVKKYILSTKDTYDFEEIY